MNMMYKEKIKVELTPLVVIASALFWLSAYSPEARTNPNNIDQGNNERLIYRGVEYVTPIWCSNSKLVLDSEKSGPILLDILKTTSKKLAASGYIGATSCSPDGRWLITVDTRTNRADKDQSGRDDDFHSVKDFSRIDLVGGKKERFIVAQGGGEWSPDGTKVMFLGSHPKLSIRQPAPQWDFFWSHDWPSGSGGVAAWMPDSQSLLLGHRGEFYLQRGDNLTKLKLITRPDVDKFSIIQIKMDVHGGVYVSANTNASSHRLFKCEINFDQIECSSITGAMPNVVTFDVSKDGRTVIYIESPSYCLRQISPAVGETKCIAKNAEGYVSISPDAKSVVFYRRRDDLAAGVYEDIYNAFVIPLKYNTLSGLAP